MIRGAALVLLAGLAGCAEEPAPGRPDAAPRVNPLTTAERERGLALCDGYVARLCACAATHPDLAERCTLARGQPDGLRLHYRFLDEALGKRDPRAIAYAEAAARKVIAACVAADGQLDPAECPRR